MPANFNPVMPLTPIVTFARLTAANTLTDGTGTAPIIFTAGAWGARVDRVRCLPVGTNVATVARVFVNNGATPATAINNALLAEIDLPATTANNAAAIGPAVELLLDISIPTTARILVCIGTAVAAGWQFVAIGGDY